MFESEIKMALINGLIPAAFDADGNAIIPNAAPIPANVNPGYVFSRLRGIPLVGGWADVSGDRYAYTDAFRGIYTISARPHRFLKRNNPPEGNPLLYEVFVASNIARQPVIEEAAAFRAPLNSIATRPTARHRNRVFLAGGAYLINENRQKFLQKYFPILTVRKEPIPGGITNISKFSIIPSTSRVVREGFALSTFHDTALTRARLDENERMRPEHRKTSQAIWTSLVLPFLMLIKPSTRASDNDVSIRITMVFVVESISAATPQALFYLTIPMRYYHISDSNAWLRDLQYSFLNRLQYTDIKRTDSDRRVRSIEMIQITFVKNNLNAGPANLGGFLPTPTPIQDVGPSNSKSVKKLIGTKANRTSSIYSTSTSTSNSTLNSKSKDKICEGMFERKNTFQWCEKTGWMLVSFKSNAKGIVNDSSGKRMCLYWACLKGIRLIEHSYYTIPEEWRQDNKASIANLQHQVHHHLVRVLKITDFKDTDGVSYGSPIFQALANVLCVDIRVNDSDWNILAHYRPGFKDLALNSKKKLQRYVERKDCAIASNRQIFSLPPFCENPTITLVLLEHVKETLTHSMGMSFDTVTEEWNAHFSCDDVRQKEAVKIRVPGSHVLPTNAGDSSLWHYWLVVSVGAKEEDDMQANKSISLPYIPLCSYCETNKCRQSLLSCTTHGPSPANSGDRRRRVFKKLQDLHKCEDCGITYAVECRHICMRPCPICKLQVPMFELDNGTHQTVCKQKDAEEDNDSMTSQQSEYSLAMSSVDSIVSSLVSSKEKAEARKQRKKETMKKKLESGTYLKCDKCGANVKRESMEEGKHKCYPDAVQYLQRHKKGVKRQWKLGRGKSQGNTFDGYIIWDLETFPCAEDNYRMKVYRCGLYHNTFAAEQMGKEGTYVDFACTNGTKTGDGDVILRMMQYLATPKFNNYIALSYFGCVFDHYLLLQYTLNCSECSQLFKVSQPDFKTAKGAKDELTDDMGFPLDGVDHRTKRYKDALKKQNDDRMKQNWVVKSKKIFSMWLSEPVEPEGPNGDIAPRYGIKFIDLGLFTQCSLKQACKDFGLSKDESKQIFPHDFISRWEDLLYEGQVPDSKYFPVGARDEAKTMKYEYERDQKVWNLMDVSEEYLRMDVLSTRQVFLKFSDTISSKLGIELVGSITLPSLSQKLLKKTLKEKVKVVIDLPYTAVEGTDWRKTIFGGRVMPLRDKFLSPELEEMEAALVMLRRSYAKILGSFVEESCYLLAGHYQMRNDLGYVGNDDYAKLPEDDSFLLLQACSEIISASKVCPPENVLVLLSHHHLPKMHAHYTTIFENCCRNVEGYMDWNDWVAIWYDKILQNGCLRAVDVSSLYPSSMAFYPYPVGSHYDMNGDQLREMTEIVRMFGEKISLEEFSYGEVAKRVGDLKSNMNWPPAFIAYIKYVPNQRLSIPVLPRKENGLLLWDLISSEGWYNSIDIENAVAMGYQIEFVRGYVWTETAFVFKDVILDLFHIKQEAENNGDVTLRSIAKLLMNSMYGKMLQKPVREYTGLIYNDYDLAVFLKYFLWTGFESVGVDDMCMLAQGITKPIMRSETERVVEWDENEAAQIRFYDPCSGKEETVNNREERWIDDQPIHLGSFILGYSRRIMLQYFCAANPSMNVETTAYYTDTDSIFLSNDQFKKLEREGLVAEGLGLLSDDFKGAIGVEAYFNNPKSYLVTKIKKATKKEPAQLWSQIKAKGIAKSCLSNTYKMGYMDEGESWLNVPVTCETMSMDYLLNIYPKVKTTVNVNEDNRSSSCFRRETILNKSCFKRGDIGGLESSDPEVFALLSDLQEIDDDARVTLNSDSKMEREEFSWEDSYDEREGDVLPVPVPDPLFSLSLSPDEMRQKRLEESQSYGRLDKFSFLNARRQGDGRSKRPLTEHVTFPTFKRFLGRNNREVEQGHTNFSIVPKTITRSFGSRLYLGAKFVRGHGNGFYRPWNNADVELYGIGNASLARSGPKGDKWAQELDENMDEDFLQIQVGASVS